MDSHAVPVPGLRQEEATATEIVGRKGDNDPGSVPLSLPTPKQVGLLFLREWGALGSYDGRPKCQARRFEF
jgi:hypothetical protein